MTKLSSRATKALEILAAGGTFRYALEDGYGGRRQFQYRLFAAGGAVVKGIGHAAFYEIKERLTETSTSSVTATYYKLSA